MTLGAIEAGGTKFVLAVGPSPEHITCRHILPTGDPVGTLTAAAVWFEQFGGIAALGIGSFGPLDIDPASRGWGKITDTPKPGWAGCDIAGFFRDRLGTPIGLDTDVNAAALAEYKSVEQDGCSSLAYITVGTGIGGGIILDGKIIHGIAHPEMGHVLPRRHRLDPIFPGICTHHGDCLEGLASGPAIMARWGGSLSNLPLGHEAHAIIADYLAQLCHTLFATTAVERVIIGGGVAKAKGLVEQVAIDAKRLAARYLPGGSRHSVSRPTHGGDAGLIGALMLAQAAQRH